MTNATTTTTITWQTTDLSRAEIARYFGLGVERDGEKWIGQIMARGREAAIAHCKSRAAGAWDANERESHAVHRSLAALIEAGAV